MKKSSSLFLLVAGVHQSTEAYPNTLHRVHQLRDHMGAQEVNFPMWETPTGGWKSTRSPARTIWRLITSHVQVLWAIARARRYDSIYIPYPAPLVAVLISLLPCRPRHMVIDGFISLYDTVVNDRKLRAPGALVSRLLYSLERRAFLKADLVVVDTPQNADFYAQIFQIPASRFLALPLATNESDYAPTPYLPRERTCRVLFIGTLVPLHGISTIIDAARLLVSRQDIEFQIIGDGANASALQAGMEGLSNTTWRRDWCTAEELAREIRASDICLGIFGDTQKAQRVCPYKLYSYASIGRATITGETGWLRSLRVAAGFSPFLGVPVKNSTALAKAIIFLADNPRERACLADSARQFYANHLSNEASLKVLERLLLPKQARHE